MVTSTTAKAFWQKLAQAPSEWFDTEDGQRLTKQAVDIVRAREGEQEANALQALIETARTVPL